MLLRMLPDLTAFHKSGAQIIVAIDEKLHDNPNGSRLPWKFNMATSTHTRLQVPLAKQYS